MKISFHHEQSAHCETGVMANLLNHHGFPITESLVFGIGSGLFFGYFPFIRLNHLPLTAFRSKTGGIMDKVAKRLGIGMEWRKFRDPAAAETALDALLEQNIPVGCRTGAYWLTYFPRRYRFHFNMHNLVVYGKEEGEYLVSDPVLEDPVRITPSDFRRARFAKGPLPPKGRMYTLTHVPAPDADLRLPVLDGIRETCRNMLSAPGPFLGVKGLRYLSRQVEKWPEKLGEDKARLYLGQLIRMQEEIGTGGAGFRFIFAAFLQESAEILGERGLRDLSLEFTSIGDRYREFAVMAGRVCKGRLDAAEAYPEMAALIRACGEEEETALRHLAEMAAEVRKKPASAKAVRKNMAAKPAPCDNVKTL